MYDNLYVGMPHTYHIHMYACTLCDHVMPTYIHMYINLRGEL